MNIYKNICSLREKLNSHNINYYVHDNPTISDQEYDLLLKELEKLDLAEIRLFDGVGAEKFAEHAFNFADKLIKEKTDNRCWVESVECAEHGANSAIYRI